MSDGYESAGVICTPCTNANAEIFDATPAIGCKITQCENNYALNKSGKHLFSLSNEHWINWSSDMHTVRRCQRS